MAPPWKLEHNRVRKRRRNTLASGEEQRRPNLVSSEEEDFDEEQNSFCSAVQHHEDLYKTVIKEVEIETDRNACSPLQQLRKSSDLPLARKCKRSSDADFSKALDMVGTVQHAQNWDAAKDAFVALRKCARHVMAETLNNEIGSAEHVLSFLLDMYAAKPIYRRLVNEMLQSFTLRSDLWAGIAKQPHMQERALAVAQGAKYEDVTNEKFLQVFSIADRHVIGPEALMRTEKRKHRQCCGWCICLSVALGCLVTYHLASMALVSHPRFASCASLVCPQNHLLKDNATCADAICTSEDVDRCCNRAAVCSSMLCPSPYIPRSNASQVTCFGIRCTLEKDAHRCCDQRALCLSMACPTHFVQKPRSAHVLCVGAICSIENDLHECCERAPSSLSNLLQCPGCQVANGLFGLSAFFARSSAESYENSLQ
jgi:hypothetical protein